MSSQLIHVDVIVPVYGRPDLFKQCMEAFHKHIGDVAYRLIVVDDKSPNDMEAEYKGLNATIVRHKENQGFPQSANDGAKASYAPIIILLNSDCFVHEGCIQAMMEEFREPSVGIVGAKLIFPEVEDMGAAGGSIQHCGMAVGINANPIHTKLGWSPDHPRCNVRRDDHQIVTGALMGVRRKIWDKLGGFCTEYGSGTFEDAEMCVRCRAEMGFKIVYTPKAVATHYAGASAKAAGIGFPLQKNQQIFLGRVGKYLRWDEWLFW